jgi:hypothetical protein
LAIFDKRMLKPVLPGMSAQNYFGYFVTNGGFIGVFEKFFLRRAKTTFLGFMIISPG